MLVTGAGQGIGRATSPALARRGYRLGLIDRERSSAPGARRGNRRRSRGRRPRGGRARAAVPSRGRRRHRGRARADRCGGRLRGGGHAVVGASTSTSTACGGCSRSTSSAWRATIEAVLPGMFARGRGHIVGIASVAGYRGMPWMPGYSASKAAIATYLEGLRPALKRRGVRITTVYPGFVRTGMTLNTPFRRPVQMLEPARPPPSTSFAPSNVAPATSCFPFPLPSAWGSSADSPAASTTVSWTVPAPRR